VYDSEAIPPARPVGTGPKASFAGFLNQTEISRAYVAADCLVLPSDTGETWGLVVNEALASGLSCIVSNACGCAEDMVAALDPRLTFSCGDIAAMAAALSFVHRQRPPRERQNEIVAAHDFRHTVATVVKLMQASQQSCRSQPS
jgi:glycosyltransferase involved in cell wall biosynthesis